MRRACDEDGRAADDAVDGGAVQVVLLAVVEVHRVHNVLAVRGNPPHCAADRVPRRIAPQPQTLALACIGDPRSMLLWFMTKPGF